MKKKSKHPKLYAKIAFQNINNNNNNDRNNNNNNDNANMNMNRKKKKRSLADSVEQDLDLVARLIDKPQADLWLARSVMHIFKNDVTTLYNKKSEL